MAVLTPGRKCPNISGHTEAKESLMPELPEVETVARTLYPALAGRSLVRVEVLNPGTWQGAVSACELDAHMPLTFAGTGRRGKVLLVFFETDEFPDTGQGLCRPALLERGNDSAIRGLAFHLRMSGRLFAYPAGTAPERHTRLILHLDDGSMIFFDDVRKFGYVRAVTPASLREWEFWRKLGPEPFELDDKAFGERFAGRGGAIKALLLDQSVIAGIGNIYADESCFRAGIRPDAPARSLCAADLGRLRAALVEVLEESIEACGSSIKDYRTARGDAGAFQNTFRVYGRSGKNCLVCGAKLRTAKIAGRTTVYCPNCQKA